MMPEEAALWENITSLFSHGEAVKECYKYIAMMFLFALPAEVGNPF